MFFGDAGDNIGGSVILEIDSNRLDCRYLRMTGDVMDHFTIFKHGLGTDVDEYQVVSKVQLRCFPNPVSNKLVIEYGIEGTLKATLLLLDNTGRPVETIRTGTHKSGNHRVLLDFGERKLENGIYFVQLMAGEKTEVFRILRIK